MRESDLEPVSITIERRCAFKARPLVCRGKGCGVERPRSHERKASRKGEPDRWPACPSCGSTEKPIQRHGCAVCGAAKGDADHWHLVSFNTVAGRDPAIYRDEIANTSAIIRPALEACGLPRPCARVVAEGHVVFPGNTTRDQGNFRVILEKALGDALKALGIVADDDWDRYEFGNLTKGVEAGAHRVIVTLFPTPAPVVVPEDDPLGGQATLAV